MMRSVTTHDPDFDDDDRAAALDWQTQQTLICKCGYPVDESMAPDRDDAYDAELWICHACAAAERAHESHRKDGGSAAGLQARITERQPLDVL